MMNLWAGNLSRRPNKCLRNQGRTRGEGWSAAAGWGPPVTLLLVVPGRLFCFGSLVVLGVVFRGLSLFLLCVNMGGG